MAVLPMPGGLGFGYYHDSAVTWEYDWAYSWDCLKRDLAKRAEDLDQRIAFAMRLEES